MQGIALGLLVGSCLLLPLAELPESATIAGACIAGALLCALLRKPPLLAAVLGLLLCWQEMGARLADRLASDRQGRDLAVEGIVASIPRPAGDGIRFVFETTPADEGLPARLQLTWYEPAWEPVPGEELRLVVRLRRPRSFANPGGADYVATLLRLGIGATGYVRAASPSPGHEPSLNSHAVLRVRALIARHILRALGERPATGIVLGLSVGLKGWISTEQWQAFSRSGTSHLMAISGMHIGAVAGLFALMAGAVQRLRQARGSSGSRRDAAVPAGLIAALIYAALAGWAVPAQRALVMLTVAAGALITRRNVSPADGLALALIVVLLLDPLAPIGAGFWLSFTAVGCLMYATRRHGISAGPLRGLLQAQAAVLVGLAPVLVTVFGQVSLAAGWVNLLAIPLYSLLVVPLVLMATLVVLVHEPAGHAMLTATAELIEWCWPLFESGSASPLASWAVPGLPKPLWLAMVLGAFAALSPLPWRGRLAGLLMLAAVCVWRPPPPSAGGLRFTLLDVGQGLAAVIQTREHLLVYDAGPVFRSGNDAARLVISPYLAYRGLRYIDMLVISHDDADHSGGANTLLRDFPVRHLVSSGAVTGVRRPVEPCKAGVAWHWDGVRFEWLHPGPRRLEKDNDRSCVLRVSTSDHAVLLTGDIESRAERAILARGDVGRVDLLIAPHHGSRTSSSRGLIAATTPRWVFFPVGHRNRWKFPADSVVNRWRTAGAQTRATDEAGAIELELIPGQGLPEPRSWRERHRRPWLER